MRQDREHLPLKKNPPTYGQLIFNKGTKNAKREKGMLGNVVGKISYPYAKEWNLFLIPYTGINSNGLKT